MSVNPEVLQKLLGEMNLSIQKNQAQYQMVNVQLQRRDNNIKLNELTLEELVTKDGDYTYDQVWKGVGKAFIKSSTKDYIKEVEEENKELKDEVKALNIKKNYIETTLNNTVNGMNKIFQRPQN